MMTNIELIHFVVKAVCPFCREPSSLAEDDDIALAYYARLDILLKATPLLRSADHKYVCPP